MGVLAYEANARLFALGVEAVTVDVLDSPDNPLQKSSAVPVRPWGADRRSSAFICG